MNNMERKLDEIDVRLAAEEYWMHGIDGEQS